MPCLSFPVLAEPEIVTSVGEVADKRRCQTVGNLSDKDNSSRHATAEEHDLVEEDESVREPHSGAEVVENMSHAIRELAAQS